MPRRAGSAVLDDTSIFLNCPFDPSYKPIFDALVFATFDCGYVARCALEIDDGGEVRVKSLRKWLSAQNKQKTLPGGLSIVKRYRNFRAQLPEILAELEIEPEEATFADYTNFVQSWLDARPRPTR